MPITIRVSPDGSRAFVSLQERHFLVMLPKTGRETMAVRIEGLVKRYKNVEAVKGIDLTVRTGETFGFLGPNGAGKSTTIKILAGILVPHNAVAIQT